jgi:hypothetical protein
MDSRSGRERQIVNIRFQLCWNLILLFVIPSGKSESNVGEGLVEDVTLPLSIHTGEWKRRMPPHSGIATSFVILQLVNED